MASNAFGFQPYPQRPSLPRKAVGAALMQQGAQAQPTMAPDDETMEEEPQFEQDISGELAEDESPYLPRTEDSAISAAMREAEDRMRRGGPMRGQQGQPGARMNAEQLKRLGLSSTEINLLLWSGGSR